MSLIKNVKNVLLQNLNLRSINALFNIEGIGLFSRSMSDCGVLRQAKSVSSTKCRVKQSSLTIKVSTHSNIDRY